MSNTSKSEQNVETVGESGDRAGIRTLDLLIKRDAASSQNQDGCVTRSQDVQGGVSPCSEESNTQFSPLERDMIKWCGSTIHMNKGLTNLYLFRSQTFFKVGLSMRVPARLKTLNQASPYPVTKLKEKLIFGNTAGAVEKYCHLLLKDYQHQGEWFRCPMDVAKKAFADACDFEDRLTEYKRSIK